MPLTLKLSPALAASIHVEMARMSWSGWDGQAGMARLRWPGWDGQAELACEAELLLYDEMLSSTHHAGGRTVDDDCGEWSK